METDRRGLCAGCAPGLGFVTNATMAHGEILWFDTSRGFGFIRPDMGPKDVFVHVSALAEAGRSELQAGEKVQFELVQAGDGRLTAQRVLPLAPVKAKRPARRR